MSTLEKCESHACVGTALAVDAETGQKVVQTYDTKVQPPELVDQVPVEEHAERVAKIAENAGATIMDTGLRGNPERFDKDEQEAYLRDLRSGSLNPGNLKPDTIYVSEQPGLNPYDFTADPGQVDHLQYGRQPVTIGA